MKDRSGKRKCVKNKGGSSSSTSKIPKGECNEKLVPNHTESLVNKSLHPGHLQNYNDIVLQLIQRKAHYLSPYDNNSSYEEWAKTQDQLAIDQASSHTIEDVLKTRIKLTKEKFVDNLNWKTLDIINYLVSSHSERRLQRSTASSKRGSFPSPQKNPIVLRADTLSHETGKKSKSGPSDKLKHAGSRGSKQLSKKLTLHKPSSTLSMEKLKEPVYPKKYEPTYKLSNYDYVKKGWTKLPDYSITYRCYTLGAEPAFPGLWAFRHRTDGRKDFYPKTNTLASDFEGDSPYFIYYPNGDVAISINEGRVGPRLIVYSMSKTDESGRWIESRPQAMFDSKGNGVVYDLEGKMRMNYDQIEGAMYSNNKQNRPVLHWYWKESTFLRMRRDDLNAVAPDHNDDIDPTRPNVESRKSKISSRKKGRKTKTGKSKSKSSRKSKVGRKSKASTKSTKSVKTKATSKHIKSSKTETPKKVESGKRKSATRKGKSTRGTKGKSRRKSNKKGGGTSKRSFRADIPPLRKRPLHPKPITEVAPIAIKITDYVSMRIMNQQHIHLDYECGTVHYRLYLGVIIKPEIVERIDKVVNPKKVTNITPCYFELMPLRSMSVYYVNKRVQEMRKEAARREYQKNIKSIGGFYAWWLKKKRMAYENKVDRRNHQMLMSVPSKRA